MIELTRVYRFEAAHRLVSAALSDAENERVFGKCSREGGHGHNYEVEVTVRGRPDARAGWLMPREELDRRVRAALIDRVDHRNLNDVMEPVTTGENLAREFFGWLEPSFRGDVVLSRVRVVETARNRFEVSRSQERSSQ